MSDFGTLSTPPEWLSPDLIVTVHDIQLREHGGASGIRDAGILSSALARLENHYAYGNDNIFVLAALYAAGIVNNHPFVDGNKRTGFLAAFIFLGANSYALDAAESDAVIMTRRLASSDINEAQFAAWLKDNSTT